ncbi:MAG: alpha/beta hydrolase, partial [Marivivens sp.]
PARFLHGTADTDVDLGFAHRLIAHASGPDIRLTIVKGADHRFSTPDCLALIAQSIAEVTNRIA